MSQQDVWSAAARRSINLAGALIVWKSRRSGVQGNCSVAGADESLFLWPDFVEVMERSKEEGSVCNSWRGTHPFIE